MYDDPSGGGGAADAGLADGLSDFCDSPGACGQTLDLKNTVIRDNHTIVNAANSDNGPNGGALEIDGQATIENTAISDNTIALTSHDGSVAALAAFEAFAGGTSRPCAYLAGNASGAVASAAAGWQAGRARARGIGTGLSRYALVGGSLSPLDIWPLVEVIQTVEGADRVGVLGCRGCVRRRVGRTARRPGYLTDERTSDANARANDRDHQKAAAYFCTSPPLCLGENRLQLKLQGVKGCFQTPRTTPAQQALRGFVYRTALTANAG